MTEVTIQIDGMSCMHCAMRVKKAIEALPGILRLNVEVGKAELQFDESQTSRQAIEAAVTKAGYKISSLSA
ncbi:MAG: heavy-metal-associated domain-containing protein [Nitrospirae bacterium]|nr:heavy-metal-associated domain-containing protein [Nitrospirota bacterium]